MPTYRYVAQAALALKATIATGIVAQLRAVEADMELAANYLPDPVEVIDYPAPHDNRSPLVQVYEDAMRPEGPAGQSNGEWTVPCSVVWSFTGDADLARSQTIRRGWFDALMRTVLADVQLGGDAVHAIFRDAALVHFEGDKSTTRHHFMVAWDVTVES